MELRHWLLILCLLAIILIFLDGYRRWRERPRYKGSYTRDEEELSEFPSGELPNGGARVRPMSPQEILERNENLNLDHKVPLLMETMSVEPEVDDFDEEESVAEKYQHSLDLPEPEQELYQPVEEDDQSELRREPSLFADADADLELDDTGADDDIEKYQLTPTEAAAVSPKPSASKAEEKVDIFETSVPGQDLIEPQEVIVINVVSEGEGFDGEQLLQILLACGMRFGAMDIFHRTNDKGQLQFSMASCMKPGTFNIDTMGQQPVAGVSFFMTLPNSADAMQSFDYMYETANVVARHMHGVLKDEMHSVMRGQTVEHCRNRIREFARAQLLNA